MSARSVDIETDRVFQERFWIAVRIGWAAMIAVMVAAILGFTGSGGTFSAQALQAGNVTVEIPSVSRWAASDTLTIVIDQPSERTTVWIPAGFGDVFSIESVTPQPQSVSAGPDGDEFVFELKPGRGETSIDFVIRPSRPVWRHRLGPFGVNGQISDASTVTVLP